MVFWLVGFVDHSVIWFVAYCRLVDCLMLGRSVSWSVGGSFWSVVCLVFFSISPLVGTLVCRSVCFSVGVSAYLSTIFSNVNVNSQSRIMSLPKSI